MLIACPVIDSINIMITLKALHEIDVVQLQLNY